MIQFSGCELSLHGFSFDLSMIQWLAGDLFYHSMGLLHISYFDWYYASYQQYINLKINVENRLDILQTYVVNIEDFSINETNIWAN